MEMASSSEPRNLGSTRDWAALLSDILHTISDGLDVIERLNFRGVCKNWRSAASLSSSPFDRWPWFLLHEEKSPNFSLLKTDSSQRFCSHIPELYGSICIASEGGWILVHHVPSNSLFFFYPFTRARINLPQLPSGNYGNYRGAFSCPPTNPDCIACVASNDESSELQLHLIRRSEETWSTQKPDRFRTSTSRLTSVVYCEETIHLVENSFLTQFSVKDKQWAYYRLVSDPPSPKTNPWPFRFSRSDLLRDGMKEKLGLPSNGVSISTCGTMVNRTDKSIFFCSDKIEDSGEEACETRKLRGVWIEPRFFDVPRNLSW